MSDKRIAPVVGIRRQALSLIEQVGATINLRAARIRVVLPAQFRFAPLFRCTRPAQSSKECQCFIA
jgi:hypothetical protein